MKSIVFGSQTLLVALAVFYFLKSTLQSRLYSKTIFLLDKEKEKKLFLGNEQTRRLSWQINENVIGYHFRYHRRFSFHLTGEKDIIKKHMGNY